MYLVEAIEYFLILQHVGRNDDIGDGVSWPECNGEDTDCEVNLVHLGETLINVIEMVDVLFEGRVDVARQLHVFEHSLQLAGEPRPALRLQLGQHALLTVNTG